MFCVYNLLSKFSVCVDLSCLKDRCVFSFALINKPEISTLLRSRCCELSFTVSGGTRPRQISASYKVWCPYRSIGQKDGGLKARCQFYFKLDLATVLCRTICVFEVAYVKLLSVKKV